MEDRHNNIRHNYMADRHNCMVEYDQRSRQTSEYQIGTAEKVKQYERLQKEGGSLAMVEPWQKTTAICYRRSMLSSGDSVCILSNFAPEKRELSNMWGSEHTVRQWSDTTRGFDPLVTTRPRPPRCELSVAKQLQRFHLDVAEEGVATVLKRHCS